MAGNAVFEVSDATFDQEVLQSEQPVLVDFWAVWCGPCKAIAPIVEDLATAYAGKLKVVKVDVDKNGATPSRYGIRGIPALLIFKGGKVADQIVGYVPARSDRREGQSRAGFKHRKRKLDKSKNGRSGFVPDRFLCACCYCR